MLQHSFVVDTPPLILSHEYLYSINDEEKEEKIEAKLYFKQTVSPSQKILLSTPYLNSYVHNSIKLKKKELKGINQYLLPFDSLVNSSKIVHSFQVSENQHITIHSHITKSGKQLLEKEKKHTFIPFIPWIIFNTLHCKHHSLRSFPMVRLYFPDDILQFYWKQFEVIYIQDYLDQHKSMSDRKNEFNFLTRKKGNLSEEVKEIECPFFSNPIWNQFVKEICSKNRKKQPIFQIYWKNKNQIKNNASFKEFKNKSFKKYKSIYLLYACFGFLIIGSISIQTLLHFEKKLYLQNKSKQHLLIKENRDIQEKQTKIKYIELDDIKKKLSFPVQDELKKIEDWISSNTMWLKKYDTSKHEIEMILLTEQENLKNEIMEQLSIIFNSSSIEIKETKKTELSNNGEEIEINEYKVIIQK